MKLAFGSAAGIPNGALILDACIVYVIARREEITRPELMVHFADHNVAAQNRVVIRRVVVRPGRRPLPVRLWPVLQSGERNRIDATDGNLVSRKRLPITSDGGSRIVDQNLDAGRVAQLPEKSPARCARLGTVCSAVTLESCWVRSHETK